MDLRTEGLLSTDNSKNYNKIEDGVLKEYNAFIEEFIKKNNLNKTIILKGFMQDKQLIFKNADLFINSSYFEGLPNALVQALNYDVFSICSDAPGGNLEVIKYGKLGLTFKKGSYFDLADKINLYLKNTYKIQGLKYKKKHLKKYTEINSYSEYIKVIRSI